ncbi:MAG TPA: response regulator [Stellaceae bacterium]|jgi:signal transduction histidine kinase|nr:response regulator [Stellaceae bacterium]
MAENDKINILLVDDQHAKLLAYEVILDELHENLLAANSAREAFTLLLKHEIAVVLIDVCMPELDGFELAAMIREHPRFKTTAIIFVSAIAMTDLDRVKGYEYGAADYVPVPVVPELLRAKVRVFAELYRKTRDLERLNVELERRVAERTAELAQANADLERRVEERTAEREQALAQVHEMQKLDSLGQLTGGLAHDFNNLLMAILGNLEMMTRRIGKEDPARRLIDGASRAAERGAALTKRLLAFARRQELRPEPIDVARLIEDMSDLLRRTLGPTIELGASFPDDLSLVHVDPNQLELAILNLSINARDAMPQGGKLMISARRETVDQFNARELAPGEFVRIAVSDSGTGMDEATLKRAAEPFFTTKGLGKGTGLGLSSVYGMAKQSGGAIAISSRVGVGTTVELWLPVAAGAEKRGMLGVPASVVKDDCARTRACSILLVDDDPMVAETTVGMLEVLGHRVKVASSGGRALEMLVGDTSVDLVITDYAMPGMTGKELARRIRETRPNLPVVLASGYAELAAQDDSGLPRLDKPYALDKLASVIGAMV